MRARTLEEPVAGPAPLPRDKSQAVPARLARLVQRAPLHLLLLVICLLWIAPAVGLLVSSFRPPNLVSTTGWWTALTPPFDFTLDNYDRVLSRNNMGRSFVNSLFVAIPATVIPILVGAYAAYAFAWMRFPGRDVLFLLVVALLVVPLQMTLIPVLRLLTDLGLTGSFLGIWLAHTAFGLPLVIFLLRNFFGSLPKEMFESAEVDGAGSMTIFFRLVLPTSVPALASVAIFQFLWVWNDLLIALVLLGGAPDVAPMTVTVSNLVNSLGRDWQLLTAAAFITMLLPLALFFSLQRYFVSGILAGSVKE